MTTIKALEREGDVRSSCEHYINLAWDAFDNHRPELGSRYIWDATDTALRNLADVRGASAATKEERREFARLLDAENGSNRYYIGGLTLGHHFLHITEVGAEPGFDLTDFARVAAQFAHHLLDLAEATE